jgi:hypothetical protein
LSLLVKTITNKMLTNKMLNKDNDHLVFVLSSLTLTH